MGMGMSVRARGKRGGPVTAREERDYEDMRAEEIRAKRWRNRGWAHDERTGCWDYCPADPQRDDNEEPDAPFCECID